MRINQNISAMNTYSRLTNANTSKSNSLAKLSSGLRINKAGDDAAGLAISEKMRGQVGGLKQAVRNAQDGISLIQTAEGALTETHSILQRMRDLAVQSANGTNTESDRAEIQKEVDQLAEELTRISTDTEFNTQNLLGGKFKADFHIGANAKQNMNLEIGDMSSNALGVAGKEAAVFKAQVTVLQGDKGSFSAGDYKVVDIKDYAGDKLTADNLGDSKIEDISQLLVDGNGKAVAYSTSDNKKEFIEYAAGNSKITFAGELKAGEEVVIADAGDDLTVTANVSVSGVDNKLQTGTYTITEIKVEGAEVGYELTNAKGETVATGNNATLTNITEWKDADGNVVLEHAANGAFLAGDSISVTGSGIDVSSAEKADEAITIINDAIESVSAERSKLGATQNRLEHTINNLTATAENLSAAESRIRDVDMAEEMMEFTKNNILSQAATAMLAQANQMPNSVLQLLQ